MWLTPEVKEHLIYWKNPRDSGIVFGLVLVFLIGIKHVSIISVLANMALALITSTMAFRIYKSVLSAVNKTQDGHPFKVSKPIYTCLDHKGIFASFSNISTLMSLCLWNKFENWS